MTTIRNTIDGLRKPFRSIVGGAKGFDTLVEDQLKKYGLPYLRFDANWSIGRSADHVRNRLMLDWLERIGGDINVIAGWDGKSAGTKGCMDEAERRGIDVWRLFHNPN